jgi:hypothetical protein
MGKNLFKHIFPEKFFSAVGTIFIQIGEIGCPTAAFVSNTYCLIDGVSQKATVAISNYRNIGFLNIIASLQSRSHQPLWSYDPGANASKFENNTYR